MPLISRWCCLLLLFIPNAVSLTISRRDALSIGSAAVASAPITLPRVSNAAADSAGEATSVMDLLARIKGVPTFCIVDPNGAAYMLVKRDERMAKGYCFTTYAGAKIVLDDAQKTANEKGYGEVWQNATITTIPADAAIRLSLTKKERFSQKDQSLDTILSIIPSAVSFISYDLESDTPACHFINASLIHCTIVLHI